jgi:hypothetical protein
MILNVLTLCVTTKSPSREILENNGAIHVIHGELIVSKEEKGR